MPDFGQNKIPKETFGDYFNNFKPSEVPGSQISIGAQNSNNIRLSLSETPPKENYRPTNIDKRELPKLQRPDGSRVYTPDESLVQEATGHDSEVPIEVFDNGQPNDGATEEILEKVGIGTEVDEKPVTREQAITAEEDQVKDIAQETEADPEDVQTEKPAPDTDTKEAHKEITKGSAGSDMQVNEAEELEIGQFSHE